MGLTREEAKSKASIRIQLFDAKGANKVIDKIYKDHEEQLKAKDIAIELLANVCKLGLETQDKYRIIIKAKDEEIERLKAMELTDKYNKLKKQCGRKR